MIETFIFIFLTLFVVFFLGYGITQLIIPKKLLPYSLWLSPWIFIIFTVFLLVNSSFLGFPIKITGPIFAFVLLAISTYYIFKNRPKVKITKRSLIILSAILLSVIFNMVPILRREGMLTTVSMGNNDVIAYATNADYLLQNSLIESFYNKVHLTVDNLLHDGYRWGIPVISAFFLSIFKLYGYQFSYLIQTILFALILPLSVVFLETIYRKLSNIGLAFLLILISLNANLLYMLYHNFFGQVFFWGIELFLFILFFIYLGSSDEQSKNINKYDILIILSIAVLYLSYHEGAVFILGPLFIYLLWRFISKTDPISYLKKLFLFGFGSLLIGSVSIFNAIVFDFGQTFASKKGQPIGWELFRQEIPFSNPFEALGFYSIHSFKPMPIVIAVTLSLIVLLLIFIGIKKSTNKPLAISYMVVFFFFYYWAAIYNNHFYDYNRALTYTLPFFIVLFAIGFFHILKKHRFAKNILIIFLCALVVFSALKLNKKLRIIYVAVDKSFASLKEVPLNKIKESIYTESFIDSTIPYWVQNWTGYFIYDNRFNHWPTVFVNGDSVNKVPDGSLVLLGKQSRWYYAPKRIVRDIVWENEYFKIGRLCYSDECLFNSDLNLYSIVINSNEYEDNLLLSGWSAREGDFRWSNSKESTARLVKRDKDIFSKILIETRSLSKPQFLELYIDNILIGSASVDTDWKEYMFSLLPLYNGVHNITLKSSSLYRPIDLGLNLDNRKLSIAIKRLEFK